MMLKIVSFILCVAFILPASAQVQSLRAHGAVGNGAADDSGALQATINDACNIGGYVYAETGSYAQAKGVTIPCALKLVGDGIDRTFFQPATGITAFTITTSDRVVMRDFVCSGASSTTCISIPSDGINRNRASLFENLWLSNCQICINFGLVTNFQVSHITAASVAGGISLNVLTSGDSTISGSDIESGPNGIDIFCAECAGLRVIDNKLTGNGEIAFYGAINRSDGDLFLTGNSAEGCGSICVLISAANTSVSFGTITITGGEYAGPDYGVYIGSSSGRVWLDGVAISGALLYGGGSGAGLLVDGTSNLTITGNVMHSAGPSLVLGPQVQYGAVVGNMCQHPMSNAGVAITSGLNSGC